MEIQVSRDLNSVSTGVHTIVSNSSILTFRVKQPKMKALPFFETSVTIYNLPWCDIPEDLGFGQQRWGTIKFLSLDNDQLDAHLLYFTIRPLQSSTCFEHCMLIIRRLNCIDAASGIVLSVSGRPVHRTAAD